MGWTARVLDAGAAFRNPLEDVEDGLFITSGDRRAKLSQFWVLLVLASLIAAGGVIGDATPAVIGAMIVAPLATPIYGVALATVTGSRSNLGASLLLLVEGIVVNILIGVLMGLVTFARMPLDANPQILGRTSPTLLDLIVAVTVGVAGSFALVRRDVSNILAGVAIAISLVPVLAVVGITLGSGRLDHALGAFVLYLTNAAAIIVSGIGVVVLVIPLADMYGFGDAKAGLVGAWYCAAGGGALGPVILAQFIPTGVDSSCVAPLIADAVIFFIAPVVFIVGWPWCGAPSARRRGGPTT